MLMSLFGHFQFLGSAGQNPNLILTLCPTELTYLNRFNLWDGGAVFCNQQPKVPYFCVGPDGNIRAENKFV